MFECINTEKCIKFAAVFISESGQIRYETSLGFSRRTEIIKTLKQKRGQIHLQMI